MIRCLGAVESDSLFRKQGFPEEIGNIKLSSIIFKLFLAYIKIKITTGYQQLQLVFALLGLLYIVCLDG